MKWLCQTHSLVVRSDGMVAPDTTMYTTYCGSFSMICLELCSDWEKRLPSIKNGLITGRNILGSGVARSWRKKVVQEWGALKVLQEMIFKDYCLARKDTMRESSSSNSWWQPQWLTELQLKDCSRKGIWIPRVDFWNWTFCSWFRAGRQQICE